MRLVTVAMSDELYRRLRRLAKQRGAELGDYITATLGDAAAPGPVVVPLSTDDERPARRRTEEVGRRRSESGLKVVIRWDRIGAGPNAPEEVHEQNARVTFHRTVERLVDILGPEAPSKLAEHRSRRSGRRSLVSPEPQTDFLNQKSGKTYANLALAGTEYFLRVHSDDKTKVDHLYRILRRLGQPSNLLETVPRKSKQRRRPAGM